MLISSLLFSRETFKMFNGPFLLFLNNLNFNYQIIVAMKTKLLKLALTLLLIPFFTTAQNNALSLNGSSQYVTANSVSDALAGTTTLSMEVWVNPNVATGQRFILSFHANNFDNLILLGTNNGLLQLSQAGAVASGSDLPLNQWSHIALTIDNTNLATVYLNGTVDFTATIANRPETGGKFTIGQEWDGAAPSDFVGGQIDEVRVWNSLRSQTEIKASMFKELAGTETGLIAYYNFNVESGTPLTDNSGNLNTGTLVNSPTRKTSGAFSGPRNALTFDGNDDYVGLADGFRLGAKFTQEMWIYPTDGTNSFRGILGGSYGGSSSASRPPCVYQHGLKIHFGFGDGASWIPSETPDVLTINSWNHIALTFDGNSYLVYVNGRLVYSTTSFFGKTPNSVPQDGIGGLDTYFKGMIDEVRIWSKTRTASEIQEDMMKTLTGTEPGLEAYYRFDETDGTTLFDIAGNDNNGTLTKMSGTEWTASEAFDTWLGVTSSAWSDASNWSDGVPTSTGNVGIYKTNLGAEASISGLPTVNNLLISSTSAPTLSSALTVNGNLITNNPVNLNGQTITLGNTAYLLEKAGSEFFGTTGIITTTRNLSNISNENIAGLGATISTVANMGSTVITRGHTVQTSGANNSIARYFDISPANNSGLNATLAFSYKEDELNGNAEAGLELFKSTDSGSSWQNQNGTVNTTSNAVSLSGISSFSTWTLIEDTQSPTAEITYSPSGPFISGDLVTITATFSEEMKDSPVPQIGISGSNTFAATNMVKSSSTVYTYEYTLQTGPGDCNVSLSTGTDLAGNVVQSTPSSGTTFTIANQNPVFTSTPVTSVDDNASYEYTIATNDGDGDAVSTSGVTVPEWLSLSDFVEVSTLGPSDLNDARGCAADALGNVYVAISDQHKILKITPEGVVSTYAGSGIRGNVNANGTNAQFDYPYDVAIDNSGNIYVSESIGQKIRKITPSGDVTTLAGLSQGYQDGTGTAARFFYPRGMTVDDYGNVYVADQHNQKIRKVTPAGVVTTIAGSIKGYQDGIGSNAMFNDPYDVTVDPSGNLYVADTYNDKIRKITPDGMVSTFASGFSSPFGISSDNSGNVYVADYRNRQIKKITPGGTVSVFAGSGSYSNIDGPATTASIKYPYGVTVNSTGNVYVANNVSIRKIESGTKLKGSAVGHAGEHPVSLKATDTNSGETLQNFTITVNDVTAPTVNGLLPLNNATGVVISSNLVITFNENIQKGTGNILIKDASNDITVQTIDVASTEVSIGDAVVTINPASDLLKSKNYYLQIPNTALTDMSSNGYVGIADKTSWSFATDLKIAPTITFADFSKIYGDADFDLAATSNSTGTISYSIIPGVTGSAGLSGTNNSTVTLGTAGTVIIRATVATDANYNEATKDISLTIGTKAITITADAKSKVYGQTDPALTYQITVDALETGDTFSGSLSRAAGENIGDYAIGSTLDNSNYDISFVPANLSITQKAVTVTADAKTKVYGSTDPALTYQVTLEGSDVLTGSLSRAAGENIGGYAIGSTLDNSNYDISFVPANLSITQKAVTVTADANTKVYGSIDPALTYQVTLEGSDVLTGSLSRAAGENIGDYAIGSTLDNSNYDISFVPANLSITQKAVTVTADAKTKVYGSTDPALTYQVTLEGSDVLTGSLSRAAGENRGDYAIGSTLTNTNYAITFVSDDLSITEKEITITADAKSKIYCDNDPLLTCQITSGDLEIGDSFSGSLIRVIGENVGSYSISIGNVSAGANYHVSFVAADLSITVKTITISCPPDIIISADTGLCGASDVNLGTVLINGDNCAVALISNDAPTIFPQGNTIVTWTVKDNIGNITTVTCEQIVTVKDTELPVANSVAPFTLQLDEFGSDIVITAEDIDNGSTDNCEIAAISIDKNTFGCANIGDNTVTLTVTDMNGNTATATTTITIQDVTAPIVITQNFTVDLNDTIEAAISTDDIDNGSVDNCGIATMSLDRTDFECATLGQYTVTLTITDNSGNTASETAVVTITSADMDNDGIADGCDDDMDGDGVANAIDNCPTISNSDQADIDRNGIGDVCDDEDLEIPKGFSPNGDGINDEFIIAGLQKYPNNSIEIYNRYGNRVYYSKNYQNYWDGVSIGKTQKLPAAPYYYVLSINGGSKIVKGWVYINY